MSECLLRRRSVSLSAVGPSGLPDHRLDPQRASLRLLRAARTHSAGMCGATCALLRSALSPLTLLEAGRGVAPAPDHAVCSVYAARHPLEGPTRIAGQHRSRIRPSVARPNGSPADSRLSKTAARCHRWPEPGMVHRTRDRPARPSWRHWPRRTVTPPGLAKLAPRGRQSRVQCCHDEDRPDHHIWRAISFSANRLCAAERAEDYWRR